MSIRDVVSVVSEGMIAVPISAQTAELLQELAALGIYGKTDYEVAARFIDQALERFVAAPVLRPRRRR